jgi:uncharacterized PurR-regulated membrane protein YhhQ (DUF165 family)
MFRKTIYSRVFILIAIPSVGLAALVMDVLEYSGTPDQVLKMIFIGLALAFALTILLKILIPKNIKTSLSHKEVKKY